MYYTFIHNFETANTWNLCRIMLNRHKNSWLPQKRDRDILWFELKPEHHLLATSGHCKKKKKIFRSIQILGSTIWKNIIKEECQGNCDEKLGVIKTHTSALDLVAFFPAVEMVLLSELTFQCWNTPWLFDFRNSKPFSSSLPYFKIPKSSCEVKR